VAGTCRSRAAGARPWLGGAAPRLCPGAFLPRSALLCRTPAPALLWRRVAVASGQACSSSSSAAGRGALDLAAVDGSGSWRRQAGLGSGGAREWGAVV